ncbi:hypothetical protein JCM19235_1316 [Vibrio maritimus]|uniref:Uncharacterized protein n=1 Tax=Vibrio maritimus TaxID=990268 RepID=A0A090S5P9_9VIBR|nr:hypothetical protein JCM19235_1316 [Vibrio maritimus]
MSFETMTVGELKEALNNFSDDTPVVATACYGDRSRTMQAFSICDPQSGYNVSKTGYSDTGYRVSDRVDDEDELKGVLVLNAELLD